MDNTMPADAPAPRIANHGIYPVSLNTGMATLNKIILLKLHKDLHFRNRDPCKNIIHMSCITEQQTNFTDIDP